MVPRPREMLNKHVASSFGVDVEGPSSEQTNGTSRRWNDDSEVRPLTRTGDHEDGHSMQRRRRVKGLKRKTLPSTVTLPLLVLIDMFAVSLVVPLLFQYYKQAGISSASQREWLSSLFSSAQIVGGISMGILTDAKVLARQTLLYISFGGSALSYALIVYGGLPALVTSRIIVGLVKQTMTVTTTMLTHSTLPAQRGMAIGRLTAASTVAWILGPTVGALLFKYVDPSAPPIMACGLFLVNLALAALFLPCPQEWKRIEADLSTADDDDDDDDDNGIHPDNQRTDSVMKKKRSTFDSIRKNMQAAFSSRALGAVVASRLIYTFVTRATSYSQLGSFYEDMYGLEPHHRGYISSYQQFLGFGVQALLVGPVMAWSGGERQTAAFLAIVLAAMIALESLRSLWLFLIVLSPIISLCMSMINLSLQTLTTQVAPTHAIFSILTALDILQSVVSVTTPFYRTFLFSFLTPGSSQNGVAMEGDPDPVTWVMTSALHWALSAGVMSVLLLSSNHWWTEAQARKPKGK